MLGHRREEVLFNSLLPPELGTRVGTAIGMWKEREGDGEPESGSTQSWRHERERRGFWNMPGKSPVDRQSCCHHLWTVYKLSLVSLVS